MAKEKSSVSLVKKFSTPHCKCNVPPTARVARGLPASQLPPSWNRAQINTHCGRVTLSGKLQRTTIIPPAPHRFKGNLSGPSFFFFFSSHTLFCDTPPPQLFSHHTATKQTTQCFHRSDSFRGELPLRGTSLPSALLRHGQTFRRVLPYVHHHRFNGDKRANGIVRLQANKLSLL